MNIDNRRIGLFIGSEFHARSVVESGVLDQLLTKYEILVFTSPAIKKKFFIQYPKLNFIEFEFSGKIHKLFSSYLLLGTLRNIKKSNSFRFRITRYILGDYFESGNFMYQLIWIFKCFFKSIKIFLTKCIAKTLLFKYIEKRYFKEIFKTFDISELKFQSFDILISWSQNAEPAAIASILLGRKIEVPSMVVADNWDNLSSKSVFPLEPNALVCFGQQSLVFARSIQNFKNCRIYPIGSARFEIYRRIIEGFEKKEPRQILYAGSSIVAEDMEILEVFEKYYQSKTVSIDFRYRRHPYPQGPILDLNNLKNKFPTLFKAELLLANSSLESLEMTKEELRTTKIMVSMPTTFLIEGLLCNIPTILISFKSKKVRTNSRKMLQELEHLKGIEKLPGVLVANNNQDLLENIDFLTKHTINSQDNSILKYYVNWERDNFSKKFIEAIEENILSN